MFIFRGAWVAFIFQINSIKAYWGYVFGLQLYYFMKLGAM
jgi:hypothetical protein